MDEQKSIIAAYGSNKNLGFAEICARIEGGDYSELRCADILGFGISADELASDLKDICFSDAELISDLHSLYSEGVQVLRIAPENGTHVALVDLAKLLQELGE